MSLNIHNKPFLTLITIGVHVSICMIDEFLSDHTHILIRKVLSMPYDFYIRRLCYRSMIIAKGLLIEAFKMMA